MYAQLDNKHKLMVKKSILYIYYLGLIHDDIFFIRQVPDFFARIILKKSGLLKNHD